MLRNPCYCGVNPRGKWACQGCREDAEREDQQLNGEKNMDPEPKRRLTGAPGDDLIADDIHRNPGRYAGDGKLRSECEGGDQRFYQVEDGWMETYSGQKFHFGSPSQESIVIEDIANAIGKLCRYGGHSTRFYSVAEHSCLLALWVWSQTLDPQLAFDALMHDATEGYLVDMPRPIKHKLPAYRAIEDGLAVAIAARFGLTTPMPRIIHEADSRILRDERAQVMSDSGNDWGTDGLEPLGVAVEFWGPDVAPGKFLDLFKFFDAARHGRGI